MLRTYYGDAMHCLFCPRLLDGSDEHVILNAIGGILSSKSLICSSCNGVLGSGVDAEFLEALEVVTLLVDPPKRRRSNKARRRLLDDKGIEYDLSAGGRVRVRFQQRDANSWIADAGDVDRVEAAMQRVVASRVARGEDSSSVSFVGDTTAIGPIPISIRIDNYVAVRETLKWVLNLLGKYVLNSDAVRDRAFVEERAFVIDGVAPVLSGYLQRSLVPELFEG